MTARHLTIRARLTLLYGALVLLAGAALLAVVLALLGRIIDTAPIVFDDSFVSRLSAPGDRTTTVDVQDRAKQQIVADAEALRSDLRQRTLVPLVGPSLVALGVFGLAGFAAVWFVAGRALRPVRTITATAEQVAAGRLDTRIALTGPDDELRALADAFDAMLDRLHRAFASQRAFVGNASHELRTPVTITRTVLDVALADPAAPPELRQVGQQLLEVTERQDRIIAGLLDLARAGNAVPSPCPVDVAAVVRRVLGRYEDEAARRAVTVIADLGAAPPVPGDPVLLERLVENLVQNAMRHNLPHGGRVAVTVTATTGGVALRVANTGPVVPPDVAPLLFEPFRRAVDRVDGAQGSGLGLSIVRTVAEAHHGSVRATADPGGGLVLDVDLPTSWHGPADGDA